MDNAQDKRCCLDVGEANFQAEVLDCPRPVIVEFWAAWSRPCQILEPVLGQIAAICGTKIKLVRVNADDNPDLSLAWEVQSIPTLLCFCQGTLRARVVGTASREAILAKLEPFVSA